MTCQRPLAKLEDSQDPVLLEGGCVGVLSDPNSIALDDNPRQRSRDRQGEIVSI